MSHSVENDKFMGGGSAGSYAAKPQLTLPARQKVICSRGWLPMAGQEKAKGGERDTGQEKRKCQRQREAENPRGRSPTRTNKPQKRLQSPINRPDTLTLAYPHHTPTRPTTTVRIMSKKFRTTTTPHCLPSYSINFQLSTI